MECVHVFGELTTFIKPDLTSHPHFSRRSSVVKLLIGEDLVVKLAILGINSAAHICYLFAFLGQ